MGRPFNAIQETMLLAMTEALFADTVMAITPEQVVDNIQTQFAMIEGNARDTVGLSLYALGVALGGPIFLLKSARDRMEVIGERLANTRIDLLQDLARTRGVIYAGYYGHWEGVDEDDNRHNPVLNQIGYVLPKHRVRDAPTEVKIEFSKGRELTHEDFIGHGAIPASAGVIVIGSGAGGAVSAATLAKKWGHDVLVIEAGPHYPSTRITHEERRMTAKLFVNGALQGTKDHDFIIFQGRCVGGSTVINNGIALRMKEAGLTHPEARDVFQDWASIGAPVDEDAFNAAYDSIEQRLEIGEIEHRSGRNNGPHLLNGWAAHAAATGDARDQSAITRWFKKNYGPATAGAHCAYCGYCNTGCPYGRKHGMAQSYLIDARKAGARILAEATVRRILWRDSEDGDGRRVATGVEVELEDGSVHRIAATTGVVVAAGTMASSRILDKSGIENTGRGISLNIACPVAALMPAGHQVNAWDEDQMATYVDRGDFLIESHFQPPMSMSTLMPGWGPEHHRRMLNYNRLASAGVLFPADRKGRLEDGVLDFKLSPQVELPLLRRALAALIDVHFKNGAIEVYPALARGDTIRPGMDVEALLKERIREADDVTLSSSHPHGGNNMNRDPKKGVVDTDCRVHGTANVLVTDASVFPSCIRVNAQLTTMAMARYATARADPFA